MKKFFSKSNLLSLLSTSVLSAGLILSQLGITLTPSINEILITACGALTAAGIITSPSTDEDESEENEEDKKLSDKA